MPYRRIAYSLLAVLLSLAAGALSPAYAQDDVAYALEEPADTAEVVPWTFDVVGKIAGTQAAYREWQEGGINSLSLATTLDSRARRKTENWIQQYDLRLAFGILQQDTLDIRKSDDLIRLGAGLQYRGEGFFQTFNPTIAGRLRTQFAAGFNYDENPFEGQTETPAKTSDFFSPATVQQSLGLTYEPADWVSTRLGIAGKETIVSIQRFRPLYGVALDRPVRYEAGVESVTNVNKKIFEGVRYQSTLNLFLAFNQVDRPDLLWENVINMQVNKWLNVDFEFVALYDSDRSQAIQIKEVLSVGIGFVLI
jgi:hypothetical protein